MTDQNPSVLSNHHTTQIDDFTGGARPPAPGPATAHAACTPPAGESTPGAGFDSSGGLVGSTDSLPARPSRRNNPDAYGAVQDVLALSRVNQALQALSTARTTIEDESGTVVGAVYVGNEIAVHEPCRTCRRRPAGPEGLCPDCDGIRKHFRAKAERLGKMKRAFAQKVRERNEVVYTAARDLMLEDGQTSFLGGDSDLPIHVTDRGTFLPASVCMQLLQNIAHEVRTTAFQLDANGCPTAESVETLIHDAAAKLLDVNGVPELQALISDAIEGN